MEKCLFALALFAMASCAFIAGYHFGNLKTNLDEFQKKEKGIVSDEFPDS